MRDQAASTHFYEKVFTCDPILNIPGTTEFSLGESMTLALKSENGIKSLLAAEDI